jgi:hypothetical protein
MRNIDLFECPDGNIITYDKAGNKVRKDFFEIDSDGIPIKKVTSFRLPGDTPKMGEPDLQLRNQNEKKETDTSLTVFEYIRAKIFHLKREGEIQMWTAIKKFIVEKLLQWIMKGGGAALATYGISQGTVEETVSGIVLFIVSAIWSLISTGKIALTPPDEFQKLK